MAKTFFITTAIAYTNSPPHVGHAYEKVLADVIARYHRLKGENVFFLTGVDQHGQKVQQSAAKDGIPPAEFVKGIARVRRSREETGCAIRRLGRNKQRSTQESGSRNFAATLRRRPNLQGQTGRLLFS